MNDTDQHIHYLIDRCLQNDNAAKTEVYRIFYKMVYNASYRILQNSYDAEDVMQETFLTGFEKLASFKRISNFQENKVPLGSWFKKIAIRKSINSLRKNEKWQFSEVKDTPNDIEEDTNDWIQEKVKQVVTALPQLKSNYRTAFSLYYIEGYDLEEMTEILGISYENVRTTVTRAKQKLKELINHD